MKTVALLLFFSGLFFLSQAQPCSPNPWSLSYDGVAAHVTIVDSASLDITDVITVEAWINATQWAANNWSGSIVSKDGWSAGEFGYCLRAGGGGQLSFLIGGWNPNGTPASWQEVQSVVGAMSAGTWYHVAGSFDGNMVRLFLNGIAVDSLAFTGTILTSAGFPLRFGMYCDTAHGQRYWNGLIDEVRVWNRALPASELQQNMNMQLDTSLTHLGLVGYWRFNEGPGIVMHDISGHQNHGILYYCYPMSNVPFSNTPPPTPSIYYGSGHLTCTATSGVTYQWYFGGNIINGATQSTYTPVQYGSYTVQITNSTGCSSMSGAFNYNTTGIGDDNSNTVLSMYPLPAWDFLDISSRKGVSRVVVLDLSGRILISVKADGSEHFRLDLASLKPGMYLLKCVAKDDAEFTRKISIR